MGASSVTPVSLDGAGPGFIIQVVKRIVILVSLCVLLLIAVAALALNSLENSLDAKVAQVAQIRLEQKRIVLRQIAWLKKANADQDFRVAGTRHDRRFIGVYGFVYSVPGVTRAKANEILRHKNVNFIKGTGDGVDTAEERKLHRLAVHYAARYNTLLLHRLGRGNSGQQVTPLRHNFKIQ